MDWGKMWIDALAIGALVWSWAQGPLWAFMNAPFVAGLIPALVGLLLSKRVAEVAETNKNAEAIRSAESQIHELDRTDAAEARAPLELSQVVPPTAPSPSPGLSPDMVSELEEKIDRIKTEIGFRIRELDGRKARKYQSVARYDYRPIVLMLAKDGAITDDAAYSLVDIFTAWRASRLNRASLPPDKAQAILAFRIPRRRRGRSGQAQAAQAPAASDSTLQQEDVATA